MLKRAFSRLVARRHRWRLAHAFWFDWRDPPPGTGGCSFCESSGLFRDDQTPKPAWRVFRRVIMPLG
jgi:hypothetical protein